jgi:hypothetical protein
MPRWWRWPKGPIERCRTAPPCLPCCRPAGWRRRCRSRPASGEHRIARLFGPRGEAVEPDEGHGHGDEQRDSLPRIADHAAEGDAQRRRDQQDREDFARGRTARWGSRSGCAEFDVEEAAAVRAELLDRDLRGRGSRPRSSGCVRAHRLAVRRLGSDETRVTVWEGAKVCTTPWETRRSASTKDSGTRTYNVLRTRSTQKLPIVSACLRDRAPDHGEPEWPCRWPRKRSSAPSSASIWVSVAHRGLAAIALASSCSSRSSPRC